MSSASATGAKSETRNTNLERKQDPDEFNLGDSNWGGKGERRRSPGREWACGEEGDFLNLAPQE